MKTYKLDFGWEISFPEDWVMEVDKKGANMFYPKDDPTTAYASVFHAEREGKPAPAELMEQIFIQSLPERAEEITFSAGGLRCRAYSHRGADGVFRICAGLFAEGDLLSLNVYSENDIMAKCVLKYFESVKRS